MKRIIYLFLAILSGSSPAYAANYTMTRVDPVGIYEMTDYPLNGKTTAQIAREAPGYLSCEATGTYSVTCRLSPHMFSSMERCNEFRSRTRYSGRSSYTLADSTTPCANDNTSPYFLCKSGYSYYGEYYDDVVISPMCYKTPEGCSKWTTSLGCAASGGCYVNAYCSECNAGYYLDGDNCVSCQTGCSACISASICTTCQDGYEKNGTKCVPEKPKISGNCPSPLKKSDDGCCCVE